MYLRADPSLVEYAVQALGNVRCHASYSQSLHQCLLSPVSTKLRKGEYWITLRLSVRPSVCPSVSELVSTITWKAFIEGSPYCLCRCSRTISSSSSKKGFLPFSLLAEIACFLFWPNSSSLCPQFAPPLDILRCARFWCWLMLNCLIRHFGEFPGYPPCGSQLVASNVSGFAFIFTLEDLKLYKGVVIVANFSARNS